MDAFIKLYQTYKPQIFKYFYYLSPDKDLAEELTQETFYQAFKSFRQFKGESKISTWLFQIAKHVFYKHLNRTTKYKQVALKGSLDKVLINFDTPEKIYAQREETTNLFHAIKQLKQPQQDIIILRSYNELSFSDIGEIFNESATWARVNFYRAKQKLSTIISGGDYDEE